MHHRSVVLQTLSLQNPYSGKADARVPGPALPHHVDLLAHLQLGYGDRCRGPLRSRTASIIPLPLGLPVKGPYGCACGVEQRRFLRLPGSRRPSASWQSMKEGSEECGTRV